MPFFSYAKNVLDWKNYQTF